MSDKRKKAETQHTGSVSPEDKELTEWIAKLWTRGEFPQRIELWQTYGQNDQVLGERIFDEEFKPNEKVDPERANRIANELITAAQYDCDHSRSHKQKTYRLIVKDSNRSASPLTRRIGPLTPQRQYLVKAGENGYVDEDDEESPLTGKSLTFAYAKEMLEQSRWDKQRNDLVVGGVLKMLVEREERHYERLDSLIGRVMSMFDMWQQSEDRKADRDQQREWAQLKVMLAKEGIRSARNLLPGLFGGDKPALPNNGANGDALAGNGAPADGNGTPPAFGASPERALVDNFLTDCEETGISIKLFGEWNERDGKIVIDPPGIFLPGQFAILYGVQQGQMSPDELDKLLPNSGHKLAITQEQVKKAQEFMSEGTGMAILELVGLRSRRKEEKQQARKPTTNEAE